MSTSLTEGGTGSINFEFPERVSMLFTVEAAALSGIGIVVLIAYKLYRAVLRALRGRGVHQQDACDSSLFLTLMFGEALRVVGKVMTVKWIVDATITSPTTFCYAQGMVKTIGTNIIDWSTLAITIHTFVILVLQWNAPTHIAKYLALCVWLVVGAIVGITFGVRGIEIIGPAGSWCWVTSENRTEQILVEYLWMWTILVLTIIFYGIDALVIQGYVVIESGSRLRWVAARDRVQLKLTQANSEEERASRNLAFQLLFYPVIYFVCVFPFSLTRWLAFSGHKVPHQAAAFTTSLFSLSGLFNVILFFVTRRDMITGGALPDPESNVNAAEKGVGLPAPGASHNAGAAPAAPYNPPTNGYLPVTEHDQQQGSLLRSMPSFDPYRDAPSSSRGAGPLVAGSETGSGGGGNTTQANGWQNGYYYDDNRGRSQQAESSSSGGARILPQRRQASQSPVAAMTMTTPSTQGDEDERGFLPP